jgi:hypothetical protein
MRRIVFLFLTGLLVAGAALGEDFWLKKEYMQWTDEEVKALLANSPWAKEVTVAVPPSALGRGGGQSRGAGSGPASASPVDVEGNSGGGRGGRGGNRGTSDPGGPLVNTPEDPLIKLNMSWRGALPMRKAVVRSRLGAAAAVPAEAQQVVSKDLDDYVILLSGVPVNLARLAQNPATLNLSSLKIGKKAPIAPKGFDFQAHAQVVDVIFVFPKTAPIVADDKEVEVVLKLGQIEVKKKFNLKDMIYNGKLEL